MVRCAHGYIGQDAPWCQIARHHVHNHTAASESYGKGISAVGANPVFARVHAALNHGSAMALTQLLIIFTILSSAGSVAWQQRGCRANLRQQGLPLASVTKVKEGFCCF
jgi:hypothetical protein